MENRQQITTGTFPLIESYAAGRTEMGLRRERVTQLVQGNSAEELVDMGFPNYLLPVMKLWVDEGLDVLTSVSHPEEFDFDKITALLNLRLYQEHMSRQGVELSSILVNHYDTVPLKKSVKKPFKFGEFGSDYDLFGLGNERTSDVALDDARKEGMQMGFEDNSQQIADDMFAKLGNELNSEVQNRGILKKDKKPVLASVQTLIQTRMRDMGEILESVLGDEVTTMGELLMKFNQALMGSIFETEGNIEQSLGFDTALFSKNEKFRNLISRSIDSIVQAKGIGFLRQFPDEGEGICSVEDGNGRRSILTVVGESFALQQGGETMLISEEDAREVIRNGKPLAKLECLALFAGGATLHMGSEYGKRENFMERLGITDSAAEYVGSLRVAEDKKHGNFGIILAGTESYPPTPLAFVLLGKRGVRNIIISQAGKTNSPQEFTLPEFRAFVAKSLVGEALEETLLTEMEGGREYEFI